VVQQTLGHACSTVSEVDFDTTSDETSMSFSSQTSVREFRMNQKSGRAIAISTPAGGLQAIPRGISSRPGHHRAGQSLLVLLRFSTFSRLKTPLKRSFAESHGIDFAG
jgi:hypothetical protein